MLMAFGVLDGLVHTNYRVTTSDAVILQEGHEAYGLDEKKLGGKYKSEARVGLEQKKSYFEAWQNELADRLPGKKTASIGKFDTPATKTMENTRFSLEGKRAIEIWKAA